MSRESDGRGFLDRWSAKKHRAESGQTDDQRVPAVDVSKDNTATLQTIALEPDGSGQAAPELSPISLSPEPLNGGQATASSAAAGHGSAENSGTEQGAIHDSLPAPIDTDVAQLPADDSPLLTDADMPAIESLSADSDMSMFFNKGVSAALKRAALRHVFQQPAFNVRDGLNDYDGDYTVFEPLGDTITSDMKWHVARKERARQEALALEQQRLEAQALEEETSAQERDDESDEQPETEALEHDAAEQQTSLDPPVAEEPLQVEPLAFTDEPLRKLGELPISDEPATDVDLNTDAMQTNDADPKQLSDKEQDVKP